ncbi:E4 ORF D [Bat mastadenovirus G]|uniref:E4 ORF D n=1 Tax=Bat mastadenovirus G TaxID=2015376 RepID=A0A1J0FAR8_9ADEN|nr:E4 ORF D [Bat mastadenovirus G]APC26080.1 E4 ORF D [Bat mastadenovirus G]
MASPLCPSRPPCIRGTVTFFEDFVRQVSSYVEDPYAFLFDMMFDVTGFHFEQVMLKTTDRDKPGITFKFVFHSPLAEDRASALSKYKTLLISELYAALQADENLKFDFGDRELFSVQISETFSFCS